MEKLKVLHIKNKLSTDGATAVVYNFAQALDGKVQFDCLLTSAEGNNRRADFEALGGKVYILPKRGKRFLQKRIHKIQDYLEFFRTHPYDIIHIDTDNVMQADILYCAAKAGVKCRIMHSHASTWEADYNRIASILIRKIFDPMVEKYATLCLACSDEAAQWMFPRISKDKIVILKNGLNIEKFRFDLETRERVRKEYGIEDAFVLGHVGRFVEIKNHRFMLDVLEQLLKMQENVKLLLVGEGPLLPEIKKMAQKKHLESNIVFAEPTAHVESYLNAMDVFLFPSIYEGLGMAAVEAQTNGLACIASTGVPIEAKISEGFQRLELQAGIEAWSDAVRNACELKPDRQSGTAAARSAGYSITDEANALYLIYKSAVEANKNTIH